MKLLLPLLMLAGLAPVAALLPAPAHAQVGTRAYAPEDLRQLSEADRRRVIGLEYAEQSGGRAIPDDQLRFYLDQVARSNWTFSRIKQDIAQSLRGDGNMPRPPEPPAAETLRCESFNNRASVCQTPWRGPSRLLRALSGTYCVEGRTWRSQPGQVHVDGNCRGEFAAAGVAPPSPGYSVTCRSVLVFPGECDWNPLHGPPMLERQLSAAPCVEGSSWQYDERRRRITVRNGCDAVFSGQRNGPPASGYSVTCASTRGQRLTCAWNSRQGQPYIVERLPGSAQCTPGRSWGYDGRAAIWVSANCKARFAAR